MKPVFWKVLLLVLPLLALIVLAVPDAGVALAQQPTGSIPTVTGTPRGPFITVNLDNDFVRVRSGPSTYFYPELTVLLAGQQAPAIGRSPGGDWIQIRVDGVPGGVGWVYAPLVTLSPGAVLPIVEPPPTPTPLATPTINPTLAAAFQVPLTPTRLPTFTPAPPLVVPTFTDTIEAQTGRVPMGLVIFVLALIGVVSALIAVVRGR